MIDELDELDELDDGRLVVVNVSGITDSYLDYVQPGYGEDNTGYALWDVQGNILLGTRKGRIPPES